MNQSYRTKSLAVSVITVVILMMILSSCQLAPQAAAGRETLFQYATLDALLAGVYDGELTLAELKQHGDFGLGTFNHLDGEMIELDGQVYQIKADGVAYRAGDEMRTPFAVVTDFEPDQRLSLKSGLDCEQLKTYLDSLLPSRNIPYALKIEGDFSYLKTRSVPAQTKPYPPLLEVLADQPEFEFEPGRGVIVGFRLPDYMDGANAVGYHFHFINEARTAGGHLLACRVQAVTVEIDYIHEWQTVLPENEAFYGIEATGDEYQ